MPTIRSLLDRIRLARPEPMPIPAPRPAPEPPANDHHEAVERPVKVDEPPRVILVSPEPPETPPRVDQPPAGITTVHGDYKTNYGAAYTPNQRRDDARREAQLAYLTDRYGPREAARLMLQATDETPEGADRG